jgi:hypothetical protein
MGPANRDLAVLHHSAARHAHELVALFRRLAPRTEPAPDSLAEMARLTALQWDTYVRLDAAQYWGAEALKENRRLDDERHAAIAQAEAAARERDELAAEVSRRRGEWDALLATRRYRFARALARPLDELRRRR